MTQPFSPAEMDSTDPHNRKLISNVHPSDWLNPKPASSYNFVVIGAGTAGLICAAGAAGLGAKVALIEKAFMGGDCLNYGCVPSKSMIRSSRVCADIKSAGSFGIDVPAGSAADFGRVMERTRRIRAEISGHDSAKRFRDLGVDVFLGEASFLDSTSVQVEGKTLRFKKAVIATGARPVVPALEGLNEAGFLTNETIFNLTALPKRLGVVGSGPIGCELAQAFARFGSRVSLLDRSSQILGREDPDAVRILRARFEKEGIAIFLNAKLKKVKKGPEGKRIYFEQDQKELSIIVDEILMGAGRAPNVEGLNLDRAGVEKDEKGIKVSELLQTSNPHIYAAGDVCLKHKFTHTAEAAAKIVIQNALFGGKKKTGSLIIPWCTYTDPEVAHVGMSSKEAEEKGLQVETFTHALKEVDRAVTDGEDEGFFKVHVKKGTDQILGATIVARHAGEMISEITLAMTGKLGLKKISEVIHPYPTQADGIKAVAGAYNRTRLKPGLKKLLTRWFEWRR